jgi:hypothetical protein
MAGAWTSQKHISASGTGAGPEVGSARAALAHPPWCDPGYCAAGGAGLPVGEDGHRAVPVALDAGTASGVVSVSAGLFQVHSPCLTSVFVEFTVHESGDGACSSPGTLRVTVEQARDFARAIIELTGVGTAWQDEQLARMLAGTSLG